MKKILWDFQLISVGSRSVLNYCVYAKVNQTFEYLEEYSLLSCVFLGCQKHGKFSYFLKEKRRGIRWGGEKEEGLFVATT